MKTVNIDAFITHQKTLSHRYVSGIKPDQKILNHYRNDRQDIIQDYVLSQDIPKYNQTPEFSVLTKKYKEYRKDFLWLAKCESNNQDIQAYALESLFQYNVDDTVMDFIYMLIQDMGHAHSPVMVQSVLLTDVMNKFILETGDIFINNVIESKYMDPAKIMMFPHCIRSYKISSNTIAYIQQLKKEPYGQRNQI